MGGEAVTYKNGLWALDSAAAKAGRLELVQAGRGVVHEGAVCGP